MAKNTVKGGAAAVVAVKPVAKGATPPAPVIAAPAAAKPAASDAAPKKAKKDRGTLAQRVTGKVVRAQKTIARLAAALAGWGPDCKVAADALAESVQYANEAASSLSKLPTDWKPAGRGGAERGERLAVGAMVEVAANARKHYESILEPSDMLALEVVKLAGKQAVVKTKDGLRTLIHSSRLRPAGHGAAQAAKRAAREEAEAAE